MDNRVLGVALVVMALAVLMVDYSFTMEFVARGLELHKTCPLPPEVCPFISPPWQGIFIGIACAALLVIGVFIYRKPSHVQHPSLGPKEKSDVEAKLEGDDKAVYDLVKADNGMLFQSALIEKTGFTKVKVSRVLDSLEMKGLVERKRRGMTNIVVLK